MTNKEKRVALAKDVLAQLRAKKLAPRTGTYCRVDDDGTCHVCALGALVVACCNPDEVESKEAAIACLVPLFSRQQVALIEAAFEQYSDPPTAEGTSVSRKALATAAEMFSSSYRKEGEMLDVFMTRYLAACKRRMRAIMRNIIDNDGTFVVAS